MAQLEVKNFMVPLAVYSAIHEAIGNNCGQPCIDDADVRQRVQQVLEAIAATGFVFKVGEKQ